MTFQNEPIAIIGSACRFSGGASSPSKLWELLREPRDVLTAIPEDRFSAKGFYHPDGLHHGHSNVQHSYMLSEDIRAFDAQFFGIKAVEAKAMDPQQRFLLETVYEGLESAGLTIQGLRGSNTAVYAGLMCGDYEAMLLRDHSTLPTYHSIGIGRSVLSNRISYFFDWHGPSMTIDTACSSSLYALHLATQALRNGETSTAIACGSNLILGPENYIAESKLKMLSPDSRSRMWDVDANGYARGEGVAAVVLKTLSAALADGDHIECIIRETGINQDGATNGITMPSASAQASLIRDTYAKAGLNPLTDEGRCQYFEAHGTGTPAGDPIEAEAIQKAFFPHGPAKDPLYVGSIKTVLGHTEGTAGIAAVIKASLALQNASIPPNMLFNRLNPAIEPFYSPMKIATVATPWPMVPNNGPRRASVNSFGFGGANAHAILEAYHVESKSDSATPVGPYVFSASSEQSLVASLQGYSDFLQASTVNARDLSWTLRERRSNLPFKVALPAGPLDMLKASIDAKLQEAESTPIGVRSSLSRPRVLGIFTGQGAQYARMGAELLERSPFAMSILTQLEEYLAQLPLLDRPNWSLKAEILSSAESSRLSEAALSQPLCTAIQIILVQLLGASGVTLSGVVGHSSGEIGAAYAAGYLSARDAIVIAYYRGLHAKLAESPNGKHIKGAMLAVGTSMEDANELLQEPDFAGRAVVAASNSSSSVTISGDDDAIAELDAIFEDEKKFRRRLKVDTAYHSEHMIPCCQPYIESLRAAGITPQTPVPDCTWYSTVYPDVSDFSTVEAKLSDIYWSDNMVKPVLFSQGLQKALDSATFDLVLEIGPHPALKGPATQTISEIGNELPYIGMLSRGIDAVEATSSAMGLLWCHEQNPQVKLSAYEDAVSGRTRKYNVIKDLPGYKWNHDRTYWHESRQSRRMRTRKSAVHPLLGDASPDNSKHQLSWRNLLKERELPWISGHQLQGKNVFPAAGYISTLLEASRFLAEPDKTRMIEVKDFVIHQAMTFDEEDAGLETLAALTDISRSDEYVSARFTYSAAVGRDADTLALVASGKVEVFLGEPCLDLLPPKEANPPNMVAAGDERFYASLGELGYGYSGPFRGLSGLSRKLGRAACNLDIAHHDSLLIHPASLDCAIQAVILAYCHPGDGGLWSLHVPTHFSRVRVNPALCGSAWNDTVPVMAATYDPEGPGLIGDAQIFGHNSHAAVQIEGVRAVPFAGATAADDEKMFARMRWANMHFDGNDMAKGDSITPEVTDLALAAERVAAYYMRKFLNELSVDHPARLDSTFSAYLRFGAHMIGLADDGKHRYMKREWAEDTFETVTAATSRFSDIIDVKIIRAVGEAMPRVFAGETTILEHIMATGLLSDYYVNAIGMREASGWIGRAVEQITHRYPHLNILEIGAGTGGATKSIFKRIGQEFLTYTFTDVSTGFFEEAELEFAPYKKKMSFRALDCSRDIVSQGFTPGSYDVVVASFVIHATNELEKTMSNVRRLLRPGGYVILGEGTNQNWLRDGFIFGTLPGWWAGAEEGRTISPCVTPERWNSVLINTGFSGIDVITPEPFIDIHCTSVIVAQAVNDQLTILRNPLTVAEPIVQDLVIIGGSTNQTRSLVTQIRNLVCNLVENVTCIESLSNFDASDATVLNLSELDKPVFDGTSESELEGLKRLIATERTLLWVTSNRRHGNPLSNMSHGFLSNAILENRQLGLQFLDFEETTVDARTIAEQLLRLQYGSATSKNDRLWSIEPEIVIDAAKRQLIPRLMPMMDANDRYNSARRDITRKVDPSKTPVSVVRIGNQHGLHDVSMHIPAAMDGEIELQSQFSVIAPVKTAAGPRYLMSGESSEMHYIALSTSLASKQCVTKSDAVLTTSTSGALLVKVAAQLAATSILDTVLPGQSLVVHNPTPMLARVISERAVHKDVKVFITTDTAEAPSSWISLPAYIARRDIKDALPPNVSVFVAFGGEQNDRIISCLPSNCRVEAIAPALPAYLSTSKVLAEALKHAQNDMSIISPTVIEPSDIPAHIEPLAILQWSSQVVHARVSRLDTKPLFKSDRTYWLVGLTRGLGLSICDWMIACGARYIVITSRSPQIEPAWLDMCRRKGATVKVYSNDVGNLVDVQRIHNIISATLPSLAGVMQGAMVLDDKPIREMGLPQLRTVFGPKVHGSRNLDHILHDEPLDFFLFLSSMVNVVGNLGQANYSAANAFMSSLATRRRKRGLAASVVNIGVVAGAGYVTREVADAGQKNLLMIGLRRISETDCHQMLAEGIEAGRAGLLAADEEPEISVGMRVVSPADQWQPSWFDNPKFARFILRDIHETADQDAGQNGGASIKDRLATAQNNGDVFAVVKNAFLAKLRAIMQIEDTSDEDLMRMRTNEMGMDSLIAVDLRSWFLKHFAVSIPVLEILGGVSVEELVHQAADKVPAELTPVLADKDSSLLDEHTPTDSSDPSDGSSQASEATLPTPPDSTTSATKGEETPPGEFFDEPVPKLMLERSLKPSFTQSMFWVVHSLVQDKTTLNHTGLFKLKGKIRVGDFKSAVNSVSMRHDALRTCFFEENGQLVQGILDSSPLQLEHKQISGEDEIMAEFHHLRTHEYDLASGHTVRILLLTHTPNESYLMIGAHHINIDGVCQQVLMADLAAFYCGRTGSLVPNVLQYADFAARQSDELDSGEWATDLAFWRREFATLPEPLPLNRARISTRQVLTNYDVCRIDVRVEEELSAKIKAAARAHGATAFHFYLAAFRVLIQRLFHGTFADVCIGIADANRKAEDTLASFGPFVNLLPLRFASSNRLTFSKALEAARDKTHAAITHSKPAFEAILQELKVTRTPNHSPLFQAFIDYRQGAREHDTFADCDLEMLSFEPGCTSYDLSLDIIDNAGGDALVSVLGQASLYQKEEMQVFAACYQDILREFSDNPGKRINPAPQFRKDDLQRGLQLGKGQSFQSKWTTLIHQIETVFQHQDSKVAVKIAGRPSVTYSELRQRVSTIAAALRDFGVVQGQHVGVHQGSTADWIASILAILRLGAVYVPLDPATPITRLRIIIDDCKLVALLLDADTMSHAPEFSSVAPCINVTTMDTVKPLGAVISAPDQPAVVLYTSGTTGTPKGIVLHHSVLAHEIEVSASVYGLSSDVVVLQQSAFGFDMSVLQIFLGIALGGTLCMLPQELRGDPEAITAYIVRDGVTYTCATPTEYSSWLRYGDQMQLKTSAWQVALSGGESISKSLLDAFRQLSKFDLRLFNGYGPTETTCCSTKIAVPWHDGCTSVSAGVASPNESVYILDEQMRLLPPGFPGEVVIGGAGIASGYLNNDKLTQESFVPNGFAQDDYLLRGWKTMYRTKDRGRLNADGTLSLEGRIGGDTQIKIRGIRIDLRDIENTILQAACGAVTEVVVTTRGTNSIDTYLVAHVVLSPEFEGDRTTYLDRLLAGLPLTQSTRPSVLVPIEKVPITSSGKLDRRAIEQLPMELESCLAVEVTNSEAKVKEIWEEVIVSIAGNITPATDFFHVGGTSMLLIEVRKKLEHQFGVTLRLISLFENSTLGAMTKLVEAQNIHVGDIDWRAEARVPQHIPVKSGAPVASLPKVVLLTGATGLVGGSFLRRLLDTVHVEKIICVAIRGVSARIASGNLPAPSQRLVYYSGDLATSRLGLSPTDAAIISNQIDVAIHVGADTSHTKAYTSLRLANVGGTQEVAKLCLPRRVPLHYVSTAEVAMLGRGASTFHEVSALSAGVIPSAHDAIAKGYTSSKWVSERLVENLATAADLPVWIHRPSSIVTPGDMDGSLDGRPDAPIIRSLVYYSRRLAAVPSQAERLTGSLNFVSIEDVTDGVITSVLSNRPDGRVTFKHHIADDDILLSRFREHLEAEEGRRFEMLTMTEWAARAEAIGMHTLLAAVFENVDREQKVLCFPKFLHGKGAY